jgi:hypothetical protein
MRAWVLRLLVLLAVPLAAVGPALLPGRVFAPIGVGAFEPLASEAPERAARALGGANRLAVDALYPIADDRANALARMAQGELPLWEPRFGLGLPLLGTTLSGPLHPLSWITAPFGEARSGALRALLALFLAGLGMALLLERVGLPRGAALFGALALQSGGWGLANLPITPKFEAAAALPWMLWAAYGSLGCARGSAAALVAATACAGLAGVPPIAAFAGLATAALIAARALSGAATPPRALRSLGLLACGAGLAAPQLVPMWSASRASLRQPQTAQALEAQALPGVTALSLVWPELFGSATAQLDAARDPLLWRMVAPEDAPRAATANALEWDLLVGGGLLALALAGAVALPRRARFPAALALAALGFAQGWPLVRWLYAVPGLDLGAPARAAALLWVASAWLGALGVEALLARAPRAWPTTLASLSALALGGLAATAAFDPAEAAAALPGALALRFDVDARTVADTVDLAAAPEACERVRRGAAALLAGALLAAAALALAARAQGLGRRPRAAWIALAVVVPALFARIPHLLPRAHEPALASPGMDAVVRAAGDGRLLRLDASASGIDDVLRLARPNLPRAWDVSDLTPYTAFPDRRTVELLAAVDPRCRYRSGASRLSDPALLDHPGLDLLRATAILARAPLAHPRLEPLLEREGFCVYRRSGVPPPAWIVPEAIATPGDEVALGLIATASFDPRAACLLAPGEPDRAARAHAGWRAGEVRLERPRPERIELSVRGTSGGWLVLSEAFDPGWRASVDGAPARVLRADHALMAVELEAGDHELALEYRPSSWRLGLALAGLALAAALALARAGSIRG